jgi:AcrR family transcriptional regulator
LEDKTIDQFTQAQHTASFRHKPLQQRSLDRINRFLDIAAELIDEVNLAGVTTSAVAERSASSVGSIYRYFSNIQTLFKALAERNLERFLTRVKEVGDRSPPVPLSSAESVLDAFMEMYRTEPGFSRLGFGNRVDNRLLRGDRDNLRAVAEALAWLFASAWEMNVTEDLIHHLEIATHICVALSDRAFLENSEGDPRFIEAVREIIPRYLRENLHVPS